MSKPPPHRFGGIFVNILVINGPNLNFLGNREPEIYGSKSYADLLQEIQKEADNLNIQIEFYQSNHEGDLVDAIQGAYGRMDGIIINPAAYTHTSVALLDAVKTVNIPTVEVHLSDPDTREEFRKISYIRLGCVKTIKGLGFQSYIEALRFLAGYLKK